MTISADEFASHRLSQQHVTVKIAVNKSWREISDRIESGFMISKPSINIKVKDREHFPDHAQRVAQLLIKKLNDLGYWVRVTDYDKMWLRIKWSHKKPCSIFPWHSPTPQSLEKYP